MTLFVAVARDLTITSPYTVTNKAVVSGGGEFNLLNDTALDATIIEPPADLTISKSHTGVFTQGDSGDTYTITVSNASPGSTIGAVTVVDALPAGLRAKAMSGTGWTVNLSTLTATRSDALAGLASYPPLTVTVDVDLNAPATVTNVATVSGGLETITTNDTASDPTDIGLFLPIVTVGGSLPAGTASLPINFNKPMSAATAGNAANYELRGCGADGLLGTGDDQVIPLTASYFNGITTLSFPGLPESVYRLTLRDAITTAGGIPIDGNSDGLPGGDWYADFVVIPGNNYLGIASVFSSGGVDPTAFVEGDFNGDGKLDLAVANSGSNAVQILLNAGNYNFVPGASYFSGYHNANSSAVPVSIVTADFNGDGKLDLAVANYDATNRTGTVEIFLGNGDGTFVAANTYSWPNCSPKALAAADFNGDGKIDLAVANYNSGKVTILTGNGNGNFSGFTSYVSGGNNPDALAMADFNGDGKIDLAVANEDNSTVGILLNNGDGSFPASAVTYLSGGTHPTDLAVADFNGDGKLDIVTANYGTEGGNASGVGLLINKGDGSFPLDNIPYFSYGAHPTSIAVADFNNDGNADVAVANSESSTISLLLGNGHGFLSQPITYGTANAYGPYDVLTGDFNADGRLDVAVTNSNASGTSNTVEILGGASGPAPLVLNTPNSYTFDISASPYGPGEFIQGTNNAFDGYGRLMIGGVLFQPAVPFTTADGGRTMVTTSATASGLTVNRRITVPNTGGEDFARTIDVFTNPTSSDITATVEIVGNLGSDAATSIFATSSGDTTLTPADQWFGTSGGISPALIHYIHGPAGLVPASVNLIGDNVVWTYNLTVPAGQTRELGYFTIQAADTTQAVNEATHSWVQTAFWIRPPSGLRRTTWPSWPISSSRPSRWSFLPAIGATPASPA